MLSRIAGVIDTGEGPSHKDEAQSYFLESDWVLQLTPISHELGHLDFYYFMISF
jgi:hypothetical protein